MFFGGIHTSSKCQKVLNSKPRKDILFKNKVYFISFSQEHFSSKFTNNLNQVLFQTAYANISDIDSKGSQKFFILFDSGAQRLYITESLKLNVNF